MLSIKVGLINLILLSIFMVNLNAAPSVIDNIVKFGRDINNNHAVEKLALEIVPMKTRMQIFSYVNGLAQSIEKIKNNVVEEFKTEPVIVSKNDAESNEVIHKNKLMDYVINKFKFSPDNVDSNKYRTE